MPTKKNDIDIANYDQDKKDKELIERDKGLIIKLRRVTVPIFSEMEEIYMIYKRYIDKDAKNYCGTCSSGPMNAIQRYWLKVISLDENNLKPLE